MRASSARRFLKLSFRIGTDDDDNDDDDSMCTKGFAISISSALGVVVQTSLATLVGRSGNMWD